MKIDYCSDIHLDEFGTPTLITKEFVEKVLKIEPFFKKREVLLLHRQNT